MKIVIAVVLSACAIFSSVDVTAAKAGELRHSIIVDVFPNADIDKCETKVNSKIDNCSLVYDYIAYALLRLSQSIRGGAFGSNKLSDIDVYMLKVFSFMEFGKTTFVDDMLSESERLANCLQTVCGEALSISKIDREYFSNVVRMAGDTFLCLSRHSARIEIEREWQEKAGQIYPLDGFTRFDPAEAGRIKSCPRTREPADVYRLGRILLDIGTF